MKKHLQSILGPYYRATRAAVARHRLQQALQQRPLKVIIGAAGKSQTGWIPTEVEFLDVRKPEKGWEQFFAKHPIDALLAEHVWEHLTPQEGVISAKLCFKHLRPGGHFRVAVPDGFHPGPEYFALVKPGGVGPGADDHKVLYNHLTLAQLLDEAGFEVVLLEYHDAYGQFHYQKWDPADGLIRRSREFDPRNKNGELRYTSLIVDAYKPAES